MSEKRSGASTSSQGMRLMIRVPNLGQIELASSSPSYTRFIGQKLRGDQAANAGCCRGTQLYDAPPPITGPGKTAMSSLAE